VTTGRAGAGAGGRAATVTRSGACTRLSASRRPRARCIVLTSGTPWTRHHSVDVGHVRGPTAEAGLTDLPGRQPSVQYTCKEVWQVVPARLCPAAVALLHGSTAPLRGYR